MFGRRRLHGYEQPQEPDSSFAIPPEIEPLLHRGPLVPLMESLLVFGRGRPGITRETEIIWVVRDRWGRIVGGAKAIDPDPPVLDVEIDPRHRRKGHATALYEAIKAAGIDVETGSDGSLRDRLLTPLGYAFQAGRRAKGDLK